MTNLETILEVLVSRNNRCGRHRWLGDSRRHRRIGRGEPPGEATYRVDKADFDDYVLPKLSDNSELSDSEDDDAPMAARRGGSKATPMQM